MEAVANIFLFVFDRRIEINIAGKLAFDDFFLGHAGKNGHNRGIGKFAFEGGFDLGWLEGLAGSPEDFHDLLFKITEKLTFSLTIAGTFHNLNLPPLSVDWRIGASLFDKRGIKIYTTSVA